VVVIELGANDALRGLSLAGTEDNLTQMTKAAQAAGARVTEPAWPDVLTEAFHAHATIQDYEAYRTLAYEYDNHRDGLSPVLRAALDKAARVTADEYDTARRTTKRARQALAELMEDFDALLTPSAPSAAPPPDTTGPAIFNRLWTLMGTPCVSVPGLTDPHDLPLGVQVIGRFGGDRATLEAALFIESLMPRRRDGGN
jgi:Asp-tRNA(Asn)/Glu-tRNA(Gln) amidotransferase A subunit family amidase